MSSSIFPLNEIKESASTLPVTMSMPLAKAVVSFEKGNYKDTLTHLLDFFEMSVQWVNCYFFALACSIPDAGEQKGVARAVRMVDQKRPLSFGDCVNEIFNPLLDAMQNLAPGHPLVMSLSTHVKTRKTDVLVGSAKVTGVIKIRNDYKGHSTSLSQDIYKKVVEEISPKVSAMLKGLAPIGKASVTAITKERKIVRVRGELQFTDTQADSTLFPSHYYVKFENFEALDLYPLILFRDDRYIFLFQTLKGEGVKYESSDENVHGFETENHNREFDAFMQRLMPSFDIAKEANWKELCDCMREHSTEYMLQVQKEKKYSGDLFVDRKRLSLMLDDFTASDSTLLPLSGDAGQGKTNQICHWTEMFIENSTPVLVFNGSAFAESSLPDTLKQLFGVSHKKPVKRLLDHIHAKAVEENKNVFIFFDAVNECLSYKGNLELDAEDESGEKAPLRLFSDILDVLVSPGYHRFKVITTCRSYTWINQIMPHIVLPADKIFGAGEDGEDSVPGFTDEETKEAYHKYGDLYQMATPFRAITRKIVLRLRDPLVLKFVCSNYVGSALSEHPDNYTSVALFTKMISEIRDTTFAGKKQCTLLEELSHIIMLSYLKGTSMSYVTNRDLREAYDDPEHPLHNLSNMIYRKDGLTVAYTELRNKPDRPILREVEKTVDGENVRAVEFIYERFLEYMMARAFLKMHINSSGADRAVTAKEIADAFSGALVNVVFIGAMRNVVLMEILRTGDFSTIEELVTDYSDNPMILQLVGEVFEVLIRENYEGVLFGLLRHMLSVAPSDSSMVEEFNRLKQLIASNKADSEIILKHNSLAKSLSPVVNLRNRAGVAVNNILLSDYFNENLYNENPMRLLWRLIMDEIVDVSNETCKFAYYLSRRRFTHSHTPLRYNLTERIVKEMYSDIKKHTIIRNVARNESRKRSMMFVETATRLAVLLLIDATVSQPQNTPIIKEMLSEIKGMAGYFTWNYRLVRMILPFLQTIMRKQITFQSVYVNNAVEYQGYWDNSIVPYEAEEGKWSRRRLRDAMEFVGFFNRHNANPESAECLAEKERFKEFLPVMLSAYGSGCSFTYFIMERINIIVGCTDWELVKPIFTTLLADENRDFKWFDFLQMSLMYSLLQLEVNSLKRNPEILSILEREARDWTLRCRGLFKARHSAKANPTGFYKRNVINWYCMAYCTSSGDNVPHEGDNIPVPLLYELIDLAVTDNDKELLFHLLDNISELISDFGYIKTALGAVKYVMTKYESQEAVNALNNAKCNHNRFADETLLGKIGNVLGLAKTYFPAETDRFLRTDIVGLHFPGVESFKEEILNYHSGGETLSDLFTHKFGYFLLWSLLHEKEVDDFSYEAVCSAIESADCFVWFDQVIRILCRRMFNVKL